MIAPFTTELSKAKFWTKMPASSEVSPDTPAYSLPQKISPSSPTPYSTADIPFSAPRRLNFSRGANPRPKALHALSDGTRHLRHRHLENTSRRVPLDISVTPAPHSGSTSSANCRYLC